MHPAEKILLAAGFGRRIYGGWRLRRMLSALITVVVLAIIAAVMASVLAIGGIYAVYFLLLQQGIAQLSALLIAALTALSLILIILLVIRRYILLVRSLTEAQTTAIANAFLDGLLSEN